MIGYVIANSFYFFALLHLCSHLLHPNIRKKQLQIMMSCLFSIFVSLSMWYIEGVKNFVLMFLFHFIYTFFLYSGPVRKKICILLLFPLILSSSEIFINLIASYFFSLLYLNAYSSFSFLFISALTGMTSLLMSIFITKLMEEIPWKNLPKYVFFILFLPFITLFIVPNIHDYVYLLENERIVVFSLLFLIISNFITIYIFMKSISITSKLNKLDFQKKIAEARYQYLNKLYTSNFSFLHDTIRSLTKLENYMNQDNFTSFKREVLELNHRMIKNFNMINSSSSMINSIINSNLEVIEENHIDFKSIIEFDDFSFLSLYEQQSLFSLLIEIAVSSCQYSSEKDKILILKIKKEAKILIQLIFTKSEYIHASDFEERYSILKKMLAKYHVKYYLKESFTENTSSLLLIFF